MRLTLILVLALILRLLFTVTWPPAGAMSLRGDAVAYHEMAVHLVQGDGLVLAREQGLQATAQLAGPLYPVFLAAVYRLTDRNPDAVRLVQVLLSVGTVAGVFLIGRRVWSPQVGLMAAFIAAIYPPFLSWSYYGGPAFLLTENLSVPLFTAFVAAFVWEMPMFAGLALGGAILSRVTLLGMVVLAVAWAWRAGRWPMDALGVFVCSVVVVLMPWMIRNTFMFDAPILSTQGGVVFWYGNNPAARGGYVDTPIPGNPPNASDERRTSAFGYHAGWQALTDRPARIPALLVKKALTFWAPIDSTHDPHLNVGFVLVSLAAMVGWWKLRRQPEIWLLIAPMAYLTFIALIFFGDPRFRLPIEPLLIVLAAVGITDGYQKEIL